jgi:hypothetical protein
VGWPGCWVGDPGRPLVHRQLCEPGGLCAHGYRYIYTNHTTQRDPDNPRDAHADLHRICYTHCRPDGYADLHTLTYPYVDCHARAIGDAYTHSDAQPDSDPHADPPRPGAELAARKSLKRSFPRYNLGLC